MMLFKSLRADLEVTLRAFAKLFGNHADAWGLTLIIVGVALWHHNIPLATGGPLMLALGACYWLGFALNDYFDAPYDRLEPRKAQRSFFALATAHLPIFYGLAGAVLLLTGGVFFAYGATGAVVYGVGLAAMWAYSAPPLRLKSRPGFDLLAHMLFVQTFPYAACLLVLGLDWTSLDRALLACFALASLAAQLEQQIRDYDVDCRTEGTFTTRYGLSASAGLLRAITALLFANVGLHIAAGTIPAPLLPLALLALPALTHRFLRPPDAPRPEQLIRFSILAAGLYALLWWGGMIL